MMLKVLPAATVGLLLGGAAPILAQVATPPASPAPMHPALRGGGMWGGGMWGGGMFAGLSEAGRATMGEAMRAGGNPRGDREAVKAARDRMLTVLEAETLDTNALKRAMDDERGAAQAGRVTRQAAMLAGFAKLTTADRKAFVASSLAMRQRMEARVVRMRQRGAGGGSAAAPPPQPPM